MHYILKQGWEKKGPINKLSISSLLMKEKCWYF